MYTFSLSLLIKFDNAESVFFLRWTSDGRSGHDTSLTDRRAAHYHHCAAAVGRSAWFCAYMNVWVCRCVGCGWACIWRKLNVGVIASTPKQRPSLLFLPMVDVFFTFFCFSCLHPSRHRALLPTVWHHQRQRLQQHQGESQEAAGPRHFLLLQRFSRQFTHLPQRSHTQQQGD